MKVIKKINLLKSTLISCVIGLANATNAAVVLTTEDGWEASVSGSLPVFFVNSDFDSGEDSSRIQSGFNPANLTFHVAAPTNSGLTISARVQFDTHLQGSQTQNSGLFESRIAEIQVDGELGILNIGKGFGIFNSAAINDLGSGLGVGLLSSGADTGNATNGRIGTGYVYANFNPRIMYTTQDINGFKVKIGLFNPEEPTDATGVVETGIPRIEGQLDYATIFDYGGLKLWTGFLWQQVELVAENVTYDMRGVDVGTHVDVGRFGLTLSYTDTKGIGADGLYGIGGIADADVEGSQWYVEADYTLNKTTVGISYGEGDQDYQTHPFIAPAIKNELSMVFLHRKFSDNLTLMLEYQDYQSNAAPGDYKAYIIGTQFDF